MYSKRGIKIKVFKGEEEMNIWKETKKTNKQTYFIGNCDVQQPFTLSVYVETNELMITKREG